MLPLFRHVGIREICFDGTRRDAGTTIDADLRIDIQLGIIIATMDAVDWTDIDARAVFGPNAWLRDNVRHS